MNFGVYRSYLLINKEIKRGKGGGKKTNNRKRGEEKRKEYFSFCNLYASQYLIQSRSTSNDIDQFVGNNSLSGSIVKNGVFAYHVTSVL